MNEFDQIYEASRHNIWSTYYYVAVFFGALISVAMSIVQNDRIRWAGRLLAIVGFSWLSMDMASRENQEKWRIRYEWVEANSDKVTDEDRFALFDRHALNGPFGPIFSGIGAIVTLILSNLLLTPLIGSWLRGASRIIARS